MLRTWLLSTLVGTAAVLGAQSALAGTYDNIVVIGDSFSDTGNVRAAIPGALAPPYYDGRFSNGPNYLDVLARNLGLSSTASLLGGINYAYGTASTGATSSFGLVPSLTAQLQTYFGSTGGRADPNTLYIVEGGTNDLLVGLYGLNGSNGANATSTLSGIASTAATNIASIESQLASVGARAILTISLPDLGLAPSTQASSYSGLPNEAALSGVAAATLNADVAANLQALPSTATRFYLNLYGLEDSIAAAPAQYGFTDITNPCFAGFPLPPGGSEVCAPGTENSHLFWDSLHFSAATNDIIGTAALAALPTQVPAPGPSAALLGLAATFIARHRRRAV